MNRGEIKERAERIRTAVQSAGGRITGHKGGVATFTLPANTDIDTLDLGDMRAVKIGANHFRVKLEEPRRRHGDTKAARPGTSSQAARTSQGPESHAEALLRRTCRQSQPEQ